MSDALTANLLAAVAIAALLYALQRSGPQGGRSGLGSVVVGTDNRLSTSKTTMFVWTLAILYGLLALLLAKAFGDDRGWAVLTGPKGLQEEYLLLLGGPYAAAIVAKVSAVGQATTEGKPPAHLTEKPNLGQLISDDAGATDLGDLQYLLFNLVALVFFLIDFWSAPEQGFPDLPSLLAGLVLTSAGGYAAKKFIRQSGPVLTSLVPPAGAAGQPGVLIYGTNLVIGKNVTADGKDLLPRVNLGSLDVEITDHQQILGADRLTVTLPAGATAGVALLSVVRADGLAAVGPAGSDGIPITVL